MLINNLWQPEDDTFWREQGFQFTRSIPQLNLLLLLAGASVWMIWSVLSVLMLSSGFPFSSNQLFSLIASAGLSALCVRFCGSFILHHCGVKNAILLSGYLLLIPLIWLWFALAALTTSFLQFQLLAIVCGLGGGLLAQVINSSYYLFPAKQQPLVQEVPLALANLGLILVLVVMPLLVQWPLLGRLSGEPLLLKYASSNISGRVSVGQPIWLNAVVWLPLALLVAALYFAHRLPALNVSTMALEPAVRWSGVARSLLLLVAVLVFCIVLLVPETLGRWASSVPAARELIILLAITVVFIFTRVLSSAQVGVVKPQLRVLFSREVHVLGLLYLMGMGSLLGFSLSFPLLIEAVFGLRPNNVGELVPSPVAPAVLIYGWLPVILGLVARAFGNWLAHRVLPAKINQLALLALVLSAVAMAFYCHQAQQSVHPEQLFFNFFGWALLFFMAAGISAGSVMTTVFQDLPRQQIEYGLTWIIALTTAGTFYIPQMFADHWHSSGPASIIIGFALFYGVGLVGNWYFYLRK